MRRQLSFTAPVRKPRENDYMFVQYALMRTDLASMTVGRACAQAMHLANKMVYDIEQGIDSNYREQFLGYEKMLDCWEDEARGFGTAIVLDAGGEFKIVAAIRAARAAGLHAGILIDPEYYVPDGKSGHLVKDVMTGGYIFGRKIDCEPFTKEFKLLGMD